MHVERLELRRLLAAIAWDGGAGDGLWHTPANWSGDTLPGADDDVTIDRPATTTVILSGAAAVRSLTLGRAGGTAVQTLLLRSALSLTADSTILTSGLLRMDSGELGGGGNVANGGQILWLAGTLSGTGAVDNFGHMLITGSTAKPLQRLVSNRFAGTLDWDNGDIHCTGGGITNDGTMNISGNVKLRSSGGTNQFFNAGPLHQSGTTLVEIPFDSSGPITVAVTHVGGTLRLAGGGQFRGVFDVTGTLVLSNVHYTVVGVGRIEGPGVVRVDGEAHSLGSSAWIAPRRLEIVNAGTDVEVWNLRVDELSVTGGALLRVTHGPARTAALHVDQASTLDLSDRWLEVDYDGVSPLVEIRALLARGHAGGAWTGTGISSTAAATTPGWALGYAEVAEVPGSFPTFDDTTVVIRLTRYGDANLDGTVNLQDFNRVAAGFGASDALWHQGDFNYDGTVNLQDFNLLTTQFGQTATSEQLG